MPGRRLPAAGPEFPRRPHRGADNPGGYTLHTQPANPPPLLGAGAGKPTLVWLDVYGGSDVEHSPGDRHHAGEPAAGPGGAAGEPEDGGLPVHARPASWEGAAVSRSTVSAGGLWHRCEPGGVFCKHRGQLCAHCHPEHLPGGGQCVADGLQPTAEGAGAHADLLHLSVQQPGWDFGFPVVTL